MGHGAIIRPSTSSEMSRLPAKLAPMQGSTDGLAERSALRVKTARIRSNVAGGGVRRFARNERETEAANPMEVIG